jgi:uncharacterized protein (TIGR03435 family)
MPAGTPRETARLLLRSRLADGFGLKLHCGQRGVPLYALIEAQGGFQLRPAYDPAQTSRVMNTPLLTGAGFGANVAPYLPAVAASIADVAAWLNHQKDAPVIDLTKDRGPVRYRPVRDARSRS